MDKIAYKVLDLCERYNGKMILRNNPYGLEITFLFAARKGGVSRVLTPEMIADARPEREAMEFCLEYIEDDLKKLLKGEEQW